MVHVEDLQGVVAIPAIPAMVTIPVPVHGWVFVGTAVLVLGIALLFLIYQFGFFDWFVQKAEDVSFCGAPGYAVFPFVQS